MIELPIILVLSGLFWYSGRKLGRWRAPLLGLYWSLCFVSWCLDYFLIGSLLAAIPTGIISIFFSMRADKDQDDSQRAGQESSL
jgi:hypothetical protein